MICVVELYIVLHVTIGYSIMRIAQLHVHCPMVSCDVVLRAPLLAGNEIVRLKNELAVISEQRDKYEKMINQAGELFLQNL